MAIEDIRSVIRDNIPEILNIGDRYSRIKKCIEILKNTHSDNKHIYNRQDIDDMINMLDVFLVEEETRELLMDQYWITYLEAIDIIKICDSCLFENRHWRQLPIPHVVYVNPDFPVSILDVKIGDNVSIAKECLERYNVKYEEGIRESYLKIENRLVDHKDGVSFDLYVYYTNDKISDFILNTSMYAKRWKTLSVVDDMFSGCSHEIKKFSKESILQVYYTYYNIIEVSNNSSETVIRIKSIKD